MKKKALLFLFCSLHFGFGTYAQWVKLPSPEIDNYGDVSFPTAEVGWIGSSVISGEMSPQYTKDGGLTWNMLDANFTSRRTRLIYFPTAKEGYITSADNFETSQTHITLDSGKTWRPMGSGKVKSFKKMYSYLRKLRDGSLVAVAEQPFGLGDTVKIFDQDFNVKKSYRIKQQRVYYFCDSLNAYGLDNNTLFKSTNGGKTWRALGTGILNMSNALYFTDVNHGVVVGSDATILHTNNGGLTWTLVSNKVGGFRYNHVVFTTPKIGYICGSQGTILKTLDGGLSWSNMKSSTFEHLNKLSFPDSTVGYCVGDNGTVLKLIEDKTVPQVTKVDVPNSIMCAGASYTINYTVNKKFNSNNVFKVMLSDANGSFDQAKMIGSTNSDTSGTILITIPSNTPRNFGYFVSIESSSPKSTSLTNDLFLEIQTPTTSLVSTYITIDKYRVCDGDKATISAQVFGAGNNPGVFWYNNKRMIGNGLKLTFVPKHRDTIYTVVKSSFLCKSVDSTIAPYPVKCTKDPLPETMILEEMYIKINTPITPSIRLEGKVLISSEIKGNQWYKGNMPIANANSQQYQALENGVYKVLYDDGACPSQFSNELSVVISANDELSEVNQNIGLYPNPTSEKLYISNAEGYEQFSIYQSTGQKILETKATEILDVSTLPVGLYLLEAKDYKGGRVIKKFEKR